MNPVPAPNNSIAYVTFACLRLPLISYELARDSLGRIQRTALAEPLVYRLSDVLGLPTLADLSIVAACQRPAPPPPALPACGIALTPRVSPTPVPAPAA